MSETTLAQAVSDYIIVKRTDCPYYPYNRKPVLLGFEHTGFLEYRLGSLKLWLHPNQRNNRKIKAKEVFEYIQQNTVTFLPLINSCLGLLDGYAIQENGVEAFFKVFGDKKLLLWKSVVKQAEMNPKKGLQYSYYVPFVCARRGRVEIGWLWLEDYLMPGDITPCFRENTKKSILEPQKFLAA